MPFGLRATPTLLRLFVSQDNPSPAMLQMRNDAIERMNEANHIVEEALGEVKEATAAIQRAGVAANQEKRDALYVALKNAQEAYLSTYEAQKIAYDEAASYFEAV